MSTLLEHALTYAKRGMSVIPVREKKATVRWKPYQTSPASKDQLGEWFTDDDADGVAVICGPVSGGLVCRDFDLREAYDTWAICAPDLAEELPTIETARGCHVLFVNGCDRIIHQPDGELRGAGYSLLPPSRHPSGWIYRWLHPLPEGAIPEVDPFTEGLAAAGSETEYTEQTDAVKDSVLSVHSVLSVLSVSPAAAELLVDAIARTLPRRIGERNHRIWTLCGYLKSIAAIADAEARDLRGLIQLWHQLALAVIGTEAFEDTWADFLYAWRHRRFGRGTGPMAQILAQADAAALPPGVDGYGYSPATNRLVKLCRELHRAAGDGVWFLSCRTAGELLGIPYSTAARRLGVLRYDGIIETVKPGTASRAARYRYIRAEEIGP